MEVLIFYLYLQYSMIIIMTEHKSIDLIKDFTISFLFYLNYFLINAQTDFRYIK